jgi:hypothetical protein
MNCSRYLSVFTGRFLFILLVVCTLSDQANGQGTTHQMVYNLPGESVSPQLDGKVLQVLFNGVADLYFQAEGKTDYYYITDTDGRLFTLSVPQKEGKNAGWSGRQGIVSILKVIMGDAPGLHDRIESCELDKHDLAGLMHDYHVAINGSDDGIIYELPPPSILPHIGFFAGYNYDFLEAGSSNDLAGFELDPAFYPSAGISFKAFLPRISSNLSINLDLSAGKRYVYGFYNSGAVAPPFTDIFQELHMHNYLLFTDFIAAYNFGTGRIRPFTSGGISTRTIIADNSRIETDVCYDEAVISDTYDYSPQEKFSLGLKVSFGFSIDISGIVSLSSSINYSELFVSPAYRNYRSAGVTIGANF